MRTIPRAAYQRTYRVYYVASDHGAREEALEKSVKFTWNLYYIHNVQLYHTAQNIEHVVNNNRGECVLPQEPVVGEVCCAQQF